MHTSGSRGTASSHPRSIIDHNSGHSSKVSQVLRLECLTCAMPDARRSVCSASRDHCHESTEAFCWKIGKQNGELRFRRLTDTALLGISRAGFGVENCTGNGAQRSLLTFTGRVLPHWRSISVRSPMSRSMRLLSGVAV
jgi:hypothetical protein